MTGREAAERLGVSVRQAQRLAKAGQLTAIGLDRIELDSVAHLVAQRQGDHRRVWAETTAWGAVDLLSGSDASWLGQPQRSRLRATLREMKAEDLAARVRNRAEVRHYRGHPSALRRLQPHLVTTLARGELGDLSNGNGVDGYVRASQLHALLRRWRLVEDLQGTITLRSTTMAWTVVETLASSTVLAALDLATSADDRERVTALELLGSAIERLRA